MTNDATPPRLAPADSGAIPLVVVAPEGLEAALAALPPAQAGFARAMGFAAKGGEVTVLPGPGGGIAAALVGSGTAVQRRRGRFVIGGAAARLPAGTYALQGLEGEDLEEATLGWLFESYRFGRYKGADAPRARLAAPAGIDAARIESIAAAEWLIRDLINTPAADMGPEGIEAAARNLAATHGAKVTVTSGTALRDGFPLIHAVGRAAAPDRTPRLIEMVAGDHGPALTLVGKGVAFDTGGLDIKSAASMGLMKKDMGGAAHVLGLAAMILAAHLPIRLRVLIPAVENSIGPESFRPGDILPSRKGLTVEVNNTDAEGRLILADALALAAEDAPDLTISMATLTGAARVALGADLAPFFAQEEADAAHIAAAAARVRDPVWRLPFHDAYEPQIEPALADLDNAPGGGLAGAITAALFLRRFAPDRYVHFDIYGWQPMAAPARPKGGTGQGARALFEALPALLGL